MTIHICRDFVSDAAQPESALYLTAAFMFGVLWFTQVGQTNFNMSGSYQVTAGHSASINMGAGNERAVAIPTGTHTVSSSDVGRILALRSSANPRHNSGLFRVTSVNTGSNWLFVDYRTTQDPPAETNALSFKLFLSESSFVPVSSNNAGAANTYRGNNSSTTSRVILQSPHSSSWQVRLTYESPADSAAVVSLATHAPGFGGNSSGDFPTGSYDVATVVEHLHGPLWFNTSVGTFYRGTVAAMQFSNVLQDVSSRVRFYSWGDDSTGTCVFAIRQMSSSYADGWYSLGMADDDDYELPPRTSQRLFAFGKYTSPITAIRWTSAPQASTPDLTGVAYGLNMKPVSCAMAQLCYVGGQSESLNVNGIKGESVATDNALLGETELQSVELYAGTLDSNYDVFTNAATQGVFEFDPRCMGRFPIARLGRQNFADWTLTSDVSSSWLHLDNGVFLPWQGPPVHT